MDSVHSSPGEEWRGLCELAVREHDPEKFNAILAELNRLLAERDEQRRRNKSQVDRFFCD